MDNVPKDSEMAEGISYTDDTSTASKTNTNISMERSESQVSVDAAPWSPTPSAVTLGDTPVCDSSKVSVDAAPWSPTPSVTHRDTPVCDNSTVSLDAAPLSPTSSVTLGDTPVCDSSKVSLDSAPLSSTSSVTLRDTPVCGSSKVSFDAAPWLPPPSVSLKDTPVCDSSKVSVDAAFWSPTPSVTLGDTSLCDSSKVSVVAASWSPTPSVTLGDNPVCDNSMVSVDAASWSPTPSLTLGDTPVCGSSKVSLDATPWSPTPSVTLGATPICDGSTAGHNNTTPIDQSDTDTSVAVRQHPLTPSMSYPQLNQTSGTQNSIIGNTVRDAQSCTNLSSVESDDEHDDLNVDYYDVVVLYAEADRTEATIFLKHLHDEVRLKNRESIKAALYDAPEVSAQTGLQFDILDKVSKSCSYIFVYLTKNIVEDVWFKIRQQSILMRNLDNRTWWVVPVYTKRRDENNFEIPMGLNALKGISYYANDDLYKKSVSSMVEEGRKRKQTKLLARRKKQINKPCRTDMTEGRGHDNVTAELDQLKLAQPKQGLETDCTITARDLSLNPEASTSSTQTSRPGTDQDAPITENHLNHTRLLNALASVSADGLRKMLLSQIPLGYNDFYDLLRKNKHNLGFLSKKQIKTLFPDPNDRQSPASVDQYDITLLYALVRNISSVAGPKTGWGKKLKDVPTRDTSLGASTERIRVLRNEIIGHHKDYQVDDTTFEVYWKEICQIMDDIEAVIDEQGYKEKLRRLREQMFTVSEAMRLRNMFKDDFLDKLEELKDWVKGYPYL